MSVEILAFLLASYVLFCLCFYFPVHLPVEILFNACNNNKLNANSDKLKLMFGAFVFVLFSLLCLFRPSRFFFSFPFIVMTRFCIHCDYDEHFGLSDTFHYFSCPSLAVMVKFFSSNFVDFVIWKCVSFNCKTSKQMICGCRRLKRNIYFWFSVLIWYQMFETKLKSFFSCYGNSTLIYFELI